MTQPKGIKPDAICEICGEVFRPEMGNANRFCSVACCYKPRALIFPEHDPSIALVPLTRGKFAAIDVDDAPVIGAFNWGLVSGYAARGAKGQPATYMHRVIVNADQRLHVDHVDGNKMNNCRANLRLATMSQNLCNRPAQKNNTSGFKGACFDQRSGKWRATITLNGKHICIGRFATAEEAARAYDAKAIELHGEFARLNFP